MSKVIRLGYLEDNGLDQKGKPTRLPKPLIPITIQFKHSRFLNTYALVDSGADYNLFPGGISSYLGLPRKGIEVPIRGIGSRTPIMAQRYFDVKILLGDISIDTYADFSWEQDVFLLGQNGFFDKFRQITFDRNNEKLEFVT